MLRYYGNGKDHLCVSDVDKCNVGFIFFFKIH